MDKKSLSALQDFQADKFTKRIAFQKGESVVFVLNFMPGQELPSHRHPGTDVYLLGLTGSGTITVDGAKTAFAEGDILHLEGNEEFGFINDGSEPASLYVILTKIPEPRYAENI
ncbi:cupin domain-containing protein [Paenibacillus sp. M1]|uniref:Cupin domain-containing protein n=1 Tax=Paenibacillus haidiansis TaxID=1574488 RepID=A0ABU7VMM0_9BACL